MSNEHKRTRSSDEIKRMVEHGERATTQFDQGGTEQERDGTFGYGHRAHRPDPNAHYGFAPKPERLLASSRPKEPEPEILWKRPLR